MKNLCGVEFAQLRILAIGTFAAVCEVTQAQPSDQLRTTHDGAPGQTTAHIAPAPSSESPDIMSREPRGCELPLQPAQTRSVWNSNLWPDGLVPYQFDANVSSDQRYYMRRAMDVIEVAARVRFLPRTNQANALHIRDSTVNNSFVGMIGGVQTVNIYNWNFKYIMCHELMHALGMWHEQSRPDRDQYITVNYQNIQAGYRSQYDVQFGASTLGTFDFESVMCYGPCSASVCCNPGSDCNCSGSNCVTMTARPAYAQFQGLMGNRSHLSQGDIAGLVSRYGGRPWTVTILHPEGMSESQAFEGFGTMQVGSVRPLLVNSEYACLWNGTARSFVNLNPANATSSRAEATSGSRQGGLARVDGIVRASLWNGTPSSWTSLHPNGSSDSRVYGMSSTRQVGMATLGDVTHASLWSGSAASWVDLNPLGSSQSTAYGTTETSQVGYANFGEDSHAGLWRGTAASWVDLHPVGTEYSSSVAFGVAGVQQVGITAYLNHITGQYVNHAAVWGGSAATWVNLNPTGSDYSRATATSGTQQVGFASVAGKIRASLWNGTATSWTDLSLSLPASWDYSFAESISRDSAYTYVAGWGRTEGFGAMQAVLWKIPIQSDPSSCFIDLDDGSGVGVPDGAVTIDDLLYFLVAFEAGEITADLDDGSSTGVRDGAVSIDDLLLFLARFEVGC